MDGLHTEVEQGRQSQHQLKSHYVKRIEELHAQTDAYRLVSVFYICFKYGGNNSLWNTPLTWPWSWLHV